MATITAQEKALLSLVAKGESEGMSDPYCAVYPSHVEKKLVQMTISDALKYQEDRKKQVRGTAALGRYQFISKTLNGAVEISGLDPNTTLFSPDIQDQLILGVLKQRYRGMNEWIAGKLSNVDFHLNLAKEFASIPVPYDTSRNGQPIKKGQSYYDGVGRNTAHQDPDTFLASLTDIQAGGTGEVTTVSIAASTANAPQGNSYKTKIEVQAGGGQRVKGTSVGDVERPNADLPVAGNPYEYKAPMALVSRYDFRTGKKVTDILYNGTNPVANAGLTRNNSRPPVNDIGDQPITALQKTAVTTARLSEVGELVTKTLTIDTPSGKKQIIKQFKKELTALGETIETELNNFNDIFSAAAGVATSTINNVVGSPQFVSLASSIEDLAASLSSNEVLNSSLSSLENSLKGTFQPITPSSTFFGSGNLATATDLAKNFGNNVSRNVVPGNLGGSLRDLASTFADDTIPSLQASLQQSLNIAEPEFRKFAANLRNPAVLNSLTGVSKDLQAAAASIATDPQVTKSIKDIGESLVKSLNVDLERFPAEITAPKVKRKPHAIQRQLANSVSNFRTIISNIQQQLSS